MHETNDAMSALSAEGQPIPADLQEKWDRCEKAVEDLGKQEKDLQAQLEEAGRRKTMLGELDKSISKADTRKTLPIIPDGAGDDGDSLGTAEQFRALAQQMADSNQLSRQIANRIAADLWDNSDKAQALSTYCKGEKLTGPQLESLAMQADVTDQGGTLVAPEEFSNRLIKFVDDMVHVRRIATVLPLTNADSVGIASWDTDPADADWTAEILTGSADSSARTGKRRLTPSPLGKSILMSRRLLRQSVIPAEQLVRERLAYKFAITEEKAFLTGDGADQPLGVFTADASGITTSQDVSTGNQSTSIGADGLISAKYALKSQYQGRPSTSWIFHRDAIAQIRKLKDGNGQYLWKMGLGDEMDTILEVPYLMSEYAPNTFTSGLYVGIIGDFTFYYIAESLRMELQRVDELYAANNQVGFFGRMELDGMPVLAEAFRRVKLG